MGARFPPPSGGELAGIPGAARRAGHVREAWLAAQLGSLGRSLRDVGLDPHRGALDAAAVEANRADRLVGRRRWPTRWRPVGPPGPGCRGVTATGTP